jgi:hypothetical protein
LGFQVGDAGPILDMMAVSLENLSTTTVVARTTIAAMYLIAHIISSIPNHSYYNKACLCFLYSWLLLASLDNYLNFWAFHVLAFEAQGFLKTYDLSCPGFSRGSISSVIASYGTSR